MRLSSGAAQDQYYVFTARLSARGQQKTAMRLIATCVLCLGIPALLAALSPKTSSLPGGEAALGVIAAGCVALAAPWLRHRWPSRTESATVVVTGALALAAGSLLPADPLAGLLVAVAFAFALGFTALFHSRRLLIFISAVSAFTVAWLWAKIAVDEPATAVAVVIPLVLLCVGVTYACRTIADVGGNGDAPTDLEPITGLLTRTAFYDQAATVLGCRHRDDDRFLVLIAITIDSLAAIHSIQGPRGVHAARVAAGQALRDTVRRDVILAHVSEAEFFVADTFTAPDPDPLIERLRSAIASTPMGLTASIGVVSNQLRPLMERPPLEALEEVVALATTAMFEARSAGGNQARYVLNPKLPGDGGQFPGSQ
jgi:GGDEF domain-containing protein